MSCQTDYQIITAFFLGVVNFHSSRKEHFCQQFWTRLWPVTLAIQSALLPHLFLTSSLTATPLILQASSAPSPTCCILSNSRETLALTIARESLFLSLWVP